MVIIEDTHWTGRLPHAEALVEESLATAFRMVPPHGMGEIRGTDAVTVLLADDAVLQRLNRDFRGKDQATNVLAFAELDTEAGQMTKDYLGDIAIAFGTVEREAEEQGKSLQDHLVHLVVHGYLHLAGYDHMRKDEQKDMEDKEIRILAALGVSNPYETGAGKVTA